METTATIAARIRQQIESGRLQEAHAAVDVALENSPAAGRPVLLCVKSYCLVNLGHTLEGLRVATEAHEGAKASEPSYPAVQCQALLALGFALQALEEHARAISILTDAESLAKETGDTALHGQALRRLGISCSVLGRHPQALEILESAVTAISENGSLPDRYHARFSVLNAKCRALEADGNVALNRQDQFRALYRQWLNFIDEVAAHGLTRLEAMSLGNSGIAARHAGDYTIAYDTLTRASARYARMGLKRGEATSQNHLGAVLVALNRPEEAVAAFIRGIALLEGDSPRELRDAWEELAAAYEAIDEPRLALAAFKKARDFERELHDDDARVAVARREQREEIARLSLQWSRLADEDTLTGVFNRRAFDRALARAVDGAKAGTKNGQHFSLLFFDLDHFKGVNDTLGHAMGDAVLKRFAGLLSVERRAEDMVARLGGEEFCLLLPIDSLARAGEIAERLRFACKAHPWHELDPGLAITVSVGVAASNEIEAAALTPVAVCALADRRLYCAKHEGRDRVNTSG